MPKQEKESDNSLSTTIADVNFTLMTYNYRVVLHELSEADVVVIILVVVVVVVRESCARQGTCQYA